MKHSYDYRKMPDHMIPKKYWVKRPMLQVTLLNGGRRQTVISLVDSGADACLFHSSIGNRLGIDVKSGEWRPFDGISEGHPIEAYFHTVQLQVLKFPEPITLQVGFTDSEGVIGLLGQAGFFENLVVTFERQRDIFWLDDGKKEGGDYSAEAGI